MDAKKEITAVDYDILLNVFVGKDELRTSMMQPNTVDDKTYSTDASSMIIIPNTHLKKEYPAHPKTPDYQAVIRQANPTEHLIFKDVDLFKILEKVPKEHDTMLCEKCEGRGECECCGAECNDCDGTGLVSDDYAPMIYVNDKAAIKIGEQVFSPFQLGKLEKVLVETMSDTFTVVAKNSSVVMIEVQDLKIMIARLAIENLEKAPKIFELKPIN